MDSIAPESERIQLEKLDKTVEQWLEVLRDHLATLDTQQVERLVETTRRYVGRVNEALPPTLDPEALAEIRGILLVGIARLEKELDDSRPLDILDDFIVRAESIRHIVRDILDEDVGDRNDASALGQQLLAWLPRVRHRELARLVGVSERQFQRYLSDSAQAPRRLEVVARLVALLHRAWTPEGVVAWFDRPRDDLGGHPPVEVLGDPAWESALFAAARRGRAQHGS